MLTPQRPYSPAKMDGRAKLKLRHENGRMDCTVTREKIARPYGASPRTSKDWQ